MAPKKCPVCGGYAMYHTPSERRKCENALRIAQLQALKG
jgi:hypothetical protein